jgi:hypothetical protein
VSRLPLLPRLRLDIRRHGRRLTVAAARDAAAELEAAIQRLVAEEAAELRQAVESLADRVAAQSELLSRRAEK